MLGSVSYERIEGANEEKHEAYGGEHTQNSDKSVTSCRNVRAERVSKGVYDHSGRRAGRGAEILPENLMIWGIKRKKNLLCWRPGVLR